MSQGTLHIDQFTYKESERSSTQTTTKQQQQQQQQQQHTKMPFVLHCVNSSKDAHKKADDSNAKHMRHKM